MTISELAAVTGVSAHTLRYYERMGLIPMVERDRSSGHRRYSPHHAQWIAFLRNLRECGMPIRDVRAYAKLVAKGDGSWPERREMLASHRRRVVAAIARLQEHRAVLDAKLAAGCAPAGLRVETSNDGGRVRTRAKEPVATAPGARMG